MSQPQTFTKAERLCSKKHIEALFFGKHSVDTDHAGGSRSLSAYPLRAVYAPADNLKENAAQVQILVSVSKRRFRHAVDRNRTKRLIREAYRLNKRLLYDHLNAGKHLHVAFIWIGNERCDYATLETRMKNLLQRIAENWRIAENL
ncbi:MAG: ribonuclease P protein component [Bacteroidaceae bacterium]|nr:ribonuclease P protein component [Bacteroidaceae bacterium]